MHTDVYKAKAIDTPSREHVIPSSLGGRLVAPNIIDKKTNDEFGRGIDADLSNALRWARLLLDAPSAGGESARALYPVPGSDGKNYVVGAGGAIETVPKLRVTVVGPNQLRIEGSVPNEAAMRRALAPTARELGVALDVLAGKAMAIATPQTLAPPAMTFGLSDLWGPGPYRATAKIACNMLALRDPDLFRTNQFDIIRAYVVDGIQPFLHPVQAVALGGSVRGIGKFDHLVRVEILSSGEVIALVCYFGWLAFCVRLGQVSGVPHANWSYRVDQLGGIDRVDHLEDLAIAIPSFADTASQSHEAFESLVLQQLGGLLPAVMEEQRDVWLRGLIEPHWKRLRDERGDRSQLTSEQILAFSKAVAQAVTDEMAPRIAEASVMRHAAESDRLRELADDGKPDGTGGHRSEG